MQVLLLPLLIVRMILSIIMSIATLSFLSRTDRRLEQQRARLQPGQAPLRPTSAVSGSGLVDALVGCIKGLLKGVVFFFTGTIAVVIIYAIHEVLSK